MIRTNLDKLIEISVQGKIANPISRGVMRFDAEGLPFAHPGTGGITYNIKVGDPVFGWAGDHIEPCVSSCASEKERNGLVNSAYNAYACAGNQATIISGQAKGTKGVVIGHHGGIEHVIIEFPDNVLDKLTHDDKILVRAVGQGTEFLDYPGIRVYNLGPQLLKTMGLKENKKDGVLEVPVTHFVPGYLMGSGIGSVTPNKGDYDIMTQDEGALEEYNLKSMRFGDIVAILDHDNRYGRNWRKGAVTIGIVIHSDCKISGHGPGVTALITAKDPVIRPVLKPSANLGHYLKVGRFAAKAKKSAAAKKKK